MPDIPGEVHGEYDEETAELGTEEEELPEEEVPEEDEEELPEEEETDLFGKDEEADTEEEEEELEVEETEDEDEEEEEEESPEVTVKLPKPPSKKKAPLFKKKSLVDPVEAIAESIAVALGRGEGTEEKAFAGPGGRRKRVTKPGGRKGTGARRPSWERGNWGSIRRQTVLPFRERYSSLKSEAEEPGTGEPVNAVREASAVVKSAAVGPVDALLEEFIERVHPVLKSKGMDRRSKIRKVQKALNDLAEEMQIVINETTAPSDGDVAEYIQQAVKSEVAELTTDIANKLDALEMHVVKSQEKSGLPMARRRSLGDPVTAKIRQAVYDTATSQGSYKKSAASLPEHPVVNLTEPVRKAKTAGEIAEQSVRSPAPFGVYY